MAGRRSTRGARSFYADRLERGLFPWRGADALRPATHRSPGHDCGQSRSLSRDGRRVLAQGGGTSLRLVSGPQRLALGALRPVDGWLSGWLASRPREPEPGRGINAVLPAVTSGIAPLGTGAGLNQW